MVLCFYSSTLLHLCSSTLLIFYGPMVLQFYSSLPLHFYTSITLFPYAFILQRFYVLLFYSPFCPTLLFLSASRLVCFYTSILHRSCALRFSWAGRDCPSSGCAELLLNRIVTRLGERKEGPQL